MLLTLLWDVITLILWRNTYDDTDWASVDNVTVEITYHAHNRMILRNLQGQLSVSMSVSIYLPVLPFCVSVCLSVESQQLL